MIDIIGDRAGMDRTSFKSTYMGIGKSQRGVDGLESIIKRLLRASRINSMRSIVVDDLKYVITSRTALVFEHIAFKTTRV